MNDVLFAVVLLLTGINCDDPQYLCSAVEAEDAVHISVCAFPTDNRLFLPMPWKRYPMADGRMLHLQTTNCTGA
jgi:hypothetical protein